MPVITPDMPHWFWARYDGATVHPHSGWTLFEWPATRRRTQLGVGQAHHVAFRATDDEDLRAWQDHLRGMGLSATEVQDRSYFHSVHFQAPDGLILELATDGPGFAIAEAPAALGGPRRPAAASRVAGSGTGGNREGAGAAGGVRSGK